MGDKIATRNAYGDALVALAEEYPDLVVLGGRPGQRHHDQGLYRRPIPTAFLNMGIAECQHGGRGRRPGHLRARSPLLSTFAMFAAGRAWEQVRNSIAYPHLNVKVVGSHGGLSVGEDGATHQCIEDFAIMRAIPGMMVVCPCDGQ